MILILRVGRPTLYEDVALRTKHKRETIFCEQVTHYATPVLHLCEFAVRSHARPQFPCRDFLNRLHGSALRLQELLDHHGAQHSRLWFPFRESIAAAKLFSTVTYAVRHVRGSLGHYELISAQSECRATSSKAIEILRDALVSISHGVLEQAEACAVVAEDMVPYVPRQDPEFHFAIPADRQVRHVEQIGEAVVHLATLFLNLSEDPQVQRVLSEYDCPRCADLVPDPINEESLRIVETMFHNLQSMYDTYIFESDVERQNKDLAFLRGHISIIYHLAEIGTNLVHYYVRHMSSLRRTSANDFPLPMEKENLLHLVFDYPLRFSRLYLDSAVQLCRQMIRSYSVPATVEVPIPTYRGFHVRPSTLIARIVAHYGSTVTMTLHGQEYNAGTPLELFRANEAIMAAKRRAVADMLAGDEDLNVAIPHDPEERVHKLQLLIMRLVNDGKVVVYEPDFEIEHVNAPPESTLSEVAVELIRHLVSMAKMDIQGNTTVTFSGDNRAVGDIKVLADNGYGEDRIGNNIVLPEQLSYLHR